jgi:hypothetical protein
MRFLAGEPDVWRIVCSAVIVWSVALAGRAVAQSPSSASAAGFEYFEKHVRPLLAEHCYQCHGPQKQESGLAVNTVARLRAGGDRGVLVLPGEPDASLLIQAVRYDGDDVKMPPRGKLKDEQIAVLAEWVKIGAPLPSDDAASAIATPSIDGFNLEERRKHWSYQPLAPPEIPAVTKAAWARVPMDNYMLARLEVAGLAPAGEADRRTLIRRATFDLTGLPPTPAEVQEYLQDRRPDAYERLVDRLLASPRYGERFGRHWLDVVRYCETLGFEFDYDLHNAWRYRDYVIRAFNEDVPYDQFVIEHLAGDLVVQPRRHPLEGWNESILATGFWWMHEGKQTPVDIRQDQADRIDNQLDVLGKAFLGQTIACARCHDHKFDAIATRDYYALAGYLKSSRYQQAFVDAPESRRPFLNALVAERERIKPAMADRAIAIWREQAKGIGRYLSAAAKMAPAEPKMKREEKSRQKPVEEKAVEPDERVLAVAKETGLDGSRLARWVKALSDDDLAEPDHPLHHFSRSEATSAASLPGESVTAFSGPGSGNWITTGEAFNQVPALSGEVVIGNSMARPVARLSIGGADSGLISARLQGDLRSPSFTIEKNFVHLRVAGRNARVNLVIDGYTLIMNPMYGKLAVIPASDRPSWKTIPVDRWVGHRAFFELSDSTIPAHGLNPPPSTARTPVGPDGYIAVTDIVFSDDARPPLNEVSLEHNGDSAAEHVQQATRAAIDRFEAAQKDGGALFPQDVALLNCLLEHGLLDDDQSAAENGHVARSLESFRTLEAALPEPNRAPAFADGTGEDEVVFLRGNYRTPGESAPRGMPSALAGDEPLAHGAGSGRLALARAMVSKENPLLPRVIANRLWQHHFGEGIVRTPDDFGRMGQAPTHPELLDYLARELIHGDWSLKSLQRRMVTAAAYRQSSRNSEFRMQNAEGGEPKTDVSVVDPDNRLLHRMPIRRLEAEAIRDSMLAVSGRLDETLHGPSVLPYLTPHMEGRGKPQSGPLDAAGRRSVYINSRRNFLTPLLLAFDYPVTFTPIGRRGTATIPAQALTLMNDPFIIQEANRWAERIATEGPSGARERIELMYETAFSRPPSAEELSSAIDFLQEQSLQHGTGSDDPRVWADLCHVLFNVKEFIFVK